MRQLIKDLLLTVKSDSAKESFVNITNIITDFLTMKSEVNVLTKEELFDFSTIFSSLICTFYDDVEGQIEIVYLINELTKRIVLVESYELTSISFVLDSILEKVESSMGIQSCYKILIFLKLSLDSECSKYYLKLFSVVKKIIQTFSGILTEMFILQELIFIIYSIVSGYELSEENDFILNFMIKLWESSSKNHKSSLILTFVEILLLMKSENGASKLITKIITDSKNIKLNKIAASKIAKCAILVSFCKSKSDEETELELISFLDKMSGLDSKISFHLTYNLCLTESKILTSPVLSRVLVNFIIDYAFIPNFLTDNNSSLSDESSEGIIVNSKEMLYAAKMLSCHLLFKSEKLSVAIFQYVLTKLQISHDQRDFNKSYVCFLILRVLCDNSSERLSRHINLIQLLQIFDKITYLNMYFYQTIVGILSSLIRNNIPAIEWLKSSIVD